jgi:predicted phage terminase large subunit-like protein
MISQDKNKIRTAIESEDKQKAQDSRPYYAKHYLQLDVPDHQFNWYEKIGTYLREIRLSPRDHGKTTVIPRVITEHQTLYNPGDNVLLLSKTFNQANKTLDMIETDLTKNPRIQHDFAEELEGFRRKGNQLFYNLGDTVRRDATVEATGILGDITGGHFKRIIMDDVFDEENTRTADSRKKIMGFIEGTILPLLEPGCGLLGIGTRKHWDDGYQKMIDNPAWYVLEEKAILKWPKSYEYVYETDDTGHQIITDVTNIQGEYEVLWPEKWGIKELLKQAKAMGMVKFNREYQNDAEGMKGKVFKEEWIKHYAIREEHQSESVRGHPPLSSMEIYQGDDLAIRKNEKNDFFCCETIGVTHDPYKIWILDWYHDKISFPEQVKMVKRLYDGPITPIWDGGRWNVLKIGIESNAYQVALAQQVLDEGNYPVHEINSVKDKKTRITAGSIDYENGLVMVPVDHPKYMTFLDEYVSFDEGEHDDMLDADDIARRLIMNSNEYVEIGTW